MGGPGTQSRCGNGPHSVLVWRASALPFLCLADVPCSVWDELPYWSDVGVGPHCATGNLMMPDPVRVTHIAGLFLTLPPAHTAPVQPLAGNGLRPGSGRLLLVDNEARKAAAGEEGCLVVLPTWEDCAGEASLGMWSMAHMCVHVCMGARGFMRAPFAQAPRLCVTPGGPVLHEAFDHPPFALSVCQSMAVT